MSITARTKKKRRMSQAAASTLQKPRKGAKRSKQYIVHVLGVPAGVTFTAAEHIRVKDQAARLELSVEDLIVRAVDTRFAAQRREGSQEEAPVLISRAVADLGAPRGRRRSR